MDQDVKLLNAHGSTMLYRNNHNTLQNKCLAIITRHLHEYTSCIYFSAYIIFTISVLAALESMHFDLQSQLVGHVQKPRLFISFTTAWLATPCLKSAFFILITSFVLLGKVIINKPIQHMINICTVAFIHVSISK